MAMMKFGLVGHPVSHSFSQRYFATKWAAEGVEDRQYELYDVEAVGALRSLVESEGLSGFNVTSPHKVAVMALLDALTPEANAVGAVNCVAVTPNGWVGHNTDCTAFRDTLRPYLKPHHKRALVLGTGGASRAVTCALTALGIDYSLVSRTPADGRIGYAEALTLMPDIDIVVNATPVGTWPEVGAMPIDVRGRLSERHLVYDLVYNPSPSLLMTMAAAQGAAAVDGSAMLRRQADLSELFWLSQCC